MDFVHPKQLIDIFDEPSKIATVFINNQGKHLICN